MLPSEYTIDDFNCASEILSSWLQEIDDWQYAGIPIIDLSDNTEEERKIDKDAEEQRKQIIYRQLINKIREVEDVIHSFNKPIAARVGSVSEIADVLIFKNDSRIICCTFHVLAALACFNASERLRSILQENNIETSDDIPSEVLSQTIESLGFSDMVLREIEIKLFRERCQFLYAVGYETNPESLLSAEEIGSLFRPPIKKKTIAPKTKEWGKPIISGRGNKPSKWRLRDVSEIVKSQFPRSIFPETLSR